MVDSCYEKLANAIIIRAVNDYKAALKKYRKNPYNHEAMRNVAKIETFFRSEWFLILTNLDPEYLIENLRKEVCKSESIRGK